MASKAEAVDYAPTVVIRLGLHHAVLVEVIATLAIRAQPAELAQPDMLMPLEPAPPLVPSMSTSLMEPNHAPHVQSPALPAPQPQFAPVAILDKVLVTGAVRIAQPASTQMELQSALSVPPTAKIALTRLLVAPAHRGTNSVLATAHSFLPILRIRPIHPTLLVLRATKL